MAAVLMASRYPTDQELAILADLKFLPGNTSHRYYRVVGYDLQKLSLDFGLWRASWTPTGGGPSWKADMKFDNVAAAFAHAEIEGWGRG